MELLKKERFHGATVLRGVAGFGAHSVYHTDKILRLSRDLPMIVEVVDTQENVDRLMPRLDEMIAGGMITFEKVKVMRYTHPPRRRVRSASESRSGRIRAPRRGRAGRSPGRGRTTAWPAPTAPRRAAGMIITHGII